MEWEDIGDDQFVNLETGEVHLCTLEQCTDIVSDGLYVYCQITGRAYSSGRSIERTDVTKGNLLKTFSHVKHFKEKAVVLEEIQRNLMDFFDNVVFPVPKDVPSIKQIFGKRLMQRKVYQKSDIVRLFKNWRFKAHEREFWIKHSVSLYHVFEDSKLRPEHFMVCLLSFAADPNGLKVGQSMHIAPDQKVMMRFPLPGEILKMTSIECSVLTRGKKFLQLADWSLYPYSQIQLEKT